MQAACRGREQHREVHQPVHQPAPSEWGARRSDHGRHGAPASTGDTLNGPRGVTSRFRPVKPVDLMGAWPMWIVFGIGLYFLCVVGALAWWLWPVGQAPDASKGRARTGRLDPVGRWLRWPRWNTKAVAFVALASVVLLAVPAGALWLRQKVRLDSFDPGRAPRSDLQVSAVLSGEALVPPQTLPPALFRAPELQRQRPLVEAANRDWALLDPEFVQRLLRVFEIMRTEYGFDLVLLEGYRSPERQMALWSQGPTVTLAAPHESLHQSGLAADVAFLREGRIVISERDPRA